MVLEYDAHYAHAYRTLKTFTYVLTYVLQRTILILLLNFVKNVQVISANRL